jgi:hypothetical protein
MTLILLDLKVGGAGKCTMTATVDRWGGKVLAVNFPQAYSDSIGSDYGACEPLVEEGSHTCRIRRSIRNTMRPCLSARVSDSATVDAL